MNWCVVFAPSAYRVCYAVLMQWQRGLLRKDHNHDSLLLDLVDFAVVKINIEKKTKTLSCACGVGSLRVSNSTAFCTSLLSSSLLSNPLPFYSLMVSLSLFRLFFLLSSFGVLSFFRLKGLDKDELEELKAKHRVFVTRGLVDLVHVRSTTTVFFCFLRVFSGWLTAVDTC